jgi:hypothetical protein
VSEQVILRRVALFVGGFDLQATREVATDERMSAAEVFAALASLSAKSLLVVSVTGEQVIYRLPETSRAYAFENLCDSRERAGENSAAVHADVLRLTHDLGLLGHGPAAVHPPASPLISLPPALRSRRRRGRIFGGGLVIVPMRSAVHEFSISRPMSVQSTSSVLEILLA